MTEEEIREEEYREKMQDILSNTTIEIRFVKEQQYKTAYYSLLLFAAIIGVFQIHVLIKPQYVYQALKSITMIFVVFLSYISSHIQFDHSKALTEYQKGLKDSNNKVKRYSNIRLKLYKIRIQLERLQQEEKKTEIEKFKKKMETNLEMGKRRNRWYLTFFVAVTILGAAAAEIVLWFDK